MSSNKWGRYKKYEPEWQKQVSDGEYMRILITLVGKVTWNEFQRALSAFGVEANEASSQFERLDVDGDGVISRKGISIYMGATPCKINSDKKLSHLQSSNGISPSPVRDSSGISSNCDSSKMASHKANQSENPVLIVDGSNSIMPTQSPPASKQPMRRGLPKKPKQSEHALWVGNISSSVSNPDLKKHFSHGASEEIQSVFFISESNCAFVNYRSATSCVAALARFHGSELRGLRIVCRLRNGLETSDSPKGPPGLQKHTSSSPIASLGNETFGITTGQPKLTINLSENRYFIIKSLTVEDLETSKDMGMWATQSHNDMRLSQAYESAVNVYLIFSANKSGEYVDYARMSSSITDNDLPRKAPPRTRHSLGEIELILTPTLKTPTAPMGRIIRDTARDTVFWEAMPPGNNDCRSSVVYEQATWPEFSSLGKPFSVAWLSDSRVRFSRTRGLRNPWNAHREVKIARDGTELEPSVGRNLIQLFHSM